MNAWILAARPKTLAAGVVPVVVGAASAFSESSRAWLALPCLLCALLIQIGTNLFNDHYDHLSGADGDDRVGPTRVTQSGLIASRTVLLAACFTFVLAAVQGVVVVVGSGEWSLLGVGAVCLVCGWLYTGGPFPLAYVGLGEVFVFVFFGLVATAGTAFAMTGTLDSTSLLAGAAVGALSTCLILVNNVRDVVSDTRANKKTIAVRFGPGFARAIYWLCVVVAAVAVVVVAVLARAPVLLAPLIALVPAVRNALVLGRLSGAALNPLLGASARVLFLFGVAMAVALVVA
ncbi:MAG: 1,4-dihydroxy-2-naphthoate polyprenyltransferase [Deltaproteobacteria bacterium]|nr:1,4-dihydroxy-2-naphthoate polyprenyltransferase [Deltaproteobacteria bacterium]